MNAVHGLIDWTTSPDNGNLKVGMVDLRVTDSVVYSPG
jgi:hypothetical protein